LIWADNTPGNYEIYYKKRAAGGIIWTGTTRLSWTSGKTGSPEMAVDPAGGLHIVWYDNIPGNLEIYYRKSTDGGATWTTSQRITWTMENSNNPAIAAGVAGNVHLAWADTTPGNYEIYYLRKKY
jgi:hypothetical protein